MKHAHSRENARRLRQRAARLQKMRDDPMRFFKAMGIKVYPWQRDIMRELLA
jgi:hypothetical protein